MASAEKIPSVAPKRGRKPKLKAVESVEKTRNYIAGVVLKPQNKAYLDLVKERTNQSLSYLVNVCIDSARATDMLKSTAMREPTAIRKARSVLEKWDSKGASKK